MGESVAEATLTSWLKEVGDTIELDEAVFEIATDKVDSEVPSEVEGVLVEKRFEVDDVIKVGDTVAVIELNGEAGATDTSVEEVSTAPEAVPAAVASLEKEVEVIKESVIPSTLDTSQSERFYSPLVKNIAKKEGITLEELDALTGTGKEGRVTKNDILEYLAGRKEGTPVTPAPVAPAPPEAAEPKKAPAKAPDVSRVQVSGEDEVIPMTRMGKLIAQHMIDSISTSAHVQSFIEVDVTNLVTWRNKVKGSSRKGKGKSSPSPPFSWRQ